MHCHQAHGNASVFLATTALEEFWDTRKPIVFLGEWCLLHGRRSFWAPLNGRLLESPFDNGEAAHAAYRYVQGIYEHVLPILRDILNTVHGQSYSLRFWRIVLGPWLQIYLSASYDRYIHLKRALQKYPDCTTIVLPQASFVVASDYSDFAWRLKEDSFNLQIYTKILAALGMSFPCGDQIEHTSAYAKLAVRSWKEKTLNTISNLYVSVGARTVSRILLRNSYFSRWSELQLSVKTAGKVLAIIRPLTQQALSSEDKELRKSLPTIAVGQGEFEQCLSAILFSDMPKIYLEGFREVNHDAKHIYPESPRAIMSANAWHFDETFKQWAGLAADKGTLLIGTPHGGNYGGLADVPSEDHETAIVDRYYSWGWERKDCAAEVIPFPATKLVGRKKIGASNRRNGILWATTSTPRYLMQFPTLPKSFREYILWQERFAQALHPKDVSVLRLRPHREDGGWEIAGRINHCIPDIAIENWDVPFQQSLANCRLYICDHLSTTLAEALAADKPTILFWDPLASKLRPAAQRYYDLLRKNGILFDTPESAAVAVGEVYDDVETWWNVPTRRDSVAAFCERFARNSPDAAELWAAEFKKMAVTRAC